MPVILLKKNGVLPNQKEEKHCAYSADSAVYVNADIDRNRIKPHILAMLRKLSDYFSGISFE
jgi:hypothetical protein